MAEAKEFPPRQVRAIVSEVASFLKERKETVSVAETVRPVCCFMRFVQQMTNYLRFPNRKAALHQEYLYTRNNYILLTGSLLGCWRNHIRLPTQHARRKRVLQSWSDSLLAPHFCQTAKRRLTCWTSCTLWNPVYHLPVGRRRASRVTKAQQPRSLLA